MANTPRLLPKVTYAPAYNPPDGNGGNQTTPGYSNVPGVGGDPLGGLINQAAGGVNDWIAAKGVNTNDPNSIWYKPPNVSYPNPQSIGGFQNTPESYFAGISGSGSAMPNGAPGTYDFSQTQRPADYSEPNVVRNPAAPSASGTDPRASQGGPQGGQNYGYPPANVAEAPHQAETGQGVLDKNRANYSAASASGDTANMARLDAEWKRLQPLAQQWGITPDHLVNNYMQPSNPAAKSDLSSALAAAISDHVWGDEATQAFGRPPNQLEWDEHWRAMNVGGRDPLEGHPGAVQNIQAKMQGMATGNQQGQYDQYNQWMAGQK